MSVTMRPTWAVEPRERISGRRWVVLRDGVYLGSAPTKARAESMMREMMAARNEDKALSNTVKGTEGE